MLEKMAMLNPSDTEVCNVSRATDLTREPCGSNACADSEQDDNDSSEGEYVPAGPPWPLERFISTSTVTGSELTLERLISTTNGDTETMRSSMSTRSSTGGAEAELSSDNGEELQRTVHRLDVVCENTQPGQVVAVVGSDPALGAWNPAAALELATCAETFPTWSVEMPELSSAAEFKLIVKSSCGRIDWEPIEGNRLWVPSAIDVEYTKSVEYGKL